MLENLADKSLITHLGDRLLPKNYSKIRQEIIEKIIKQNPQEWQIKKMLVFDGDCWSRNAGSSKFGWGYKEFEDCLIHKNFEEKHDNQGFLITNGKNGGKIHFKWAFTTNEWTNLENKINRAIEEERQLVNKQEQLIKLTQQNSDKDGLPWGKIVLAVLAISAIVLVIVLITKKTSKNKI